MKLTKHDINLILRKFQLAAPDSPLTDIDQVELSNPLTTNLLAIFRFRKNHYAILVDADANDDEAYIINQLAALSVGAKRQLIPNQSSTKATYGQPYKGKDVYLIRFTDQKQRLDQLLASRYPKVSRSSWQKRIEGGLVKVDQKTTKSPKQLVSPASSISITPPAEPAKTKQDLPIIYLDDDVIVVSKPSGMLTHPKGGDSGEFTVADFFRPWTTVALDSNRPGIVHRLDRDTSGVIIGARTSEAYQLLVRQFSKRQAGKQYLAITSKAPKLAKARIDLPIARNPKLPSQFRVDPNGKQSITDYQLLDSRPGEALLLLSPQTGRTHQLRVHMSYLNAPILGDIIYGRTHKADRLYLHAHKLTVAIPGQSEPVEFTAEVPKAFLDKFPDAGNL